MYKKILLCLCLSSSAFAEEHMYFQLQADAYSEPVPIHAFINDWKSDDFQVGEYAFAHGKMRLGVKKDAWDMSWVWMYDYNLKFSRDLSELYYQVKNDQQINANDNYDLRLKAQHIDAIGSRFAYQWQLNDDWQLQTGFTALMGQHFVDGQAKIYGQTTAQQELLERVDWLNGFINYHYDQPALKEDKIGWNERTNKGYGYALDVVLQGNITPNWQTKINIEDVASRMYWDDAPLTKYNIGYDQRNRPRFDIQGKFDTDHTFIQKLPYKIYAELHYQSLVQPWGVGISTMSNPYLTLAQLNANWTFQNDGKFTTLIEPQTQSLGFALQHQYFSLKYMTDHWNSNRAKRMAAMLSAQYVW